MLRATARKFLELGTRTEPEVEAIRVEVDGTTEPSTVPEATRNTRDANASVTRTA